MLIAALALTLAAQGERDDDCTDQQTQSAMNICSGREFITADAEMNRVWAEVRAVMQERDRERAEYANDGDRRSSHSAALLASQRAWLRFRDSQCLIEGYAARGGSMEPLLFNSCRRALTEDRTAALRELVRN